MYPKSAQLYDRLYHFKNYVAESAYLHASIRRWRPEARRLLDVACGTGKHLEQLGAWYDVAGLDINGDFLAVARARCPGVSFFEGDMADFELNATFDVITCIFCAIPYVRTEERLLTTLRSMKRHLEPEGIILLEPWFTPESYWTDKVTAHLVEDGEEKIVWMYVSSPPTRDGQVVVENHYLVGTPAGVHHFTERHEVGLFNDEQYRRAVEGAGLEVAHDLQGPTGRGLYIGFAEDAGRPPSP